MVPLSVAMWRPHQSAATAVTSLDGSWSNRWVSSTTNPPGAEDEAASTVAPGRDEPSPSCASSTVPSVAFLNRPHVEVSSRPDVSSHVAIIWSAEAFHSAKPPSVASKTCSLPAPSNHVRMSSTLFEASPFTVVMGVSQPSMLRSNRPTPPSVAMWTTSDAEVRDKPRTVLDGRPPRTPPSTKASLAGS